MSLHKKTKRSCFKLGLLFKTGIRSIKKTRQIKE